MLGGWMDRILAGEDWSRVSKQRAGGSRWVTFVVAKGANLRPRPWWGVDHRNLCGGGGACITPVRRCKRLAPAPTLQTTLLPHGQHPGSPS